MEEDKTFEVYNSIREIMEGERGEEIKKNALKWKKLAKEAVDEGGSSDKNIEEFEAIQLEIMLIRQASLNSV